MGKFLKSVGKDIKATSWDQPLEFTKDITKGDFDGAFKDLKSIPGDNERNQSEILNSLGIRGWVGDHPQETAAAIAATVLGGWAAAGAMGTGAGGAGAGAGAASAGAGAGAAATGAGVGATGVGATGVGLGAGTGATAAGTAAGTGAATGAGLGGSAATGAGLGAEGAGLGAGFGAEGAGGLGGSLFNTVGYGAAEGAGTSGGLGASSVGATPFAEAGSSLAYNPMNSSILGGTGEGLSSTAGTTGVSSMPFSFEGSSTSYQPLQSSTLSNDTGSFLNQGEGQQEFDVNKMIKSINQMNKATGGDKDENKQQTTALKPIKSGYSGGLPKARSQYDTGSFINNTSVATNNPFLKRS